MNKNQSLLLKAKLLVGRFHKQMLASEHKAEEKEIHYKKQEQ